MSVTFCAYDRGRPVPDAPMINVSNRNAELLLGSLGYEDDGEWVFDPAELDARLLLALQFGGAYPDHGTPSVTSYPERGPIWTDVGVRPGYLADRYGQLREVCAVAMNLHGEVIAS